MSNILIISRDLPYPPHKNGCCSSLYNYMIGWREDMHNIRLLYLSAQEAESEQALKSQIGVDCENVDITGFSISTKIDRKNILIPRNSWALDYRKCPDIDGEKYDYLIWGSLAATVIFDKIINFTGRQILFAADSLSLYYMRDLHQRHSLTRKMYLKSQFYCSKRFEKKVYSAIKNIVFVSSVDTHYAKKNFSGNFVENRIGAAVPENHIKTIDKDENKEIIDIGFSGIMDYEPNANAVEYIISHIMPRLEVSGLNYRIHIIGKNPNEQWKKSVYYDNRKLIITGFLDEIESYISKMDIYISPLFLGTGMKNKILQSMGLGVPIICSEVSAEGIDGLEHNRNVLIVSEDADEWVRAIKNLAGDPSRRKKFSEACKEIIKSQYTWKYSAKRMLEA